MTTTTQHLQTLAAALAQFSDDTNAPADRDLRAVRQSVDDLRAQIDHVLAARDVADRDAAFVAELSKYAGHEVSFAALQTGRTVGEVEEFAWTAGLEAVVTNHLRVLGKAGGK